MCKWQSASHAHTKGSEATSPRMTSLANFSSGPPSVQLKTRRRTFMPFHGFKRGGGPGGSLGGAGAAVFGGGAAVFGGDAHVRSANGGRAAFVQGGTPEDCACFCTKACTARPEAYSTT